MAVYSYNYPWSGRLGSISRCCLYCGDSGPSFQVSSFGARCLKCSHDAEPIPELVAEYEANYERLAVAWCDSRGIDYEATVANYEKNLGPKLQERNSPIPGAENDYSVPKDR